MTDLPIRSLNEIIIECADGKPLPYSGYVMVQVILSQDIIPDNIFPVLVVPDTDFITQIPILLGTNIIKVFKLQCKESHEVDINSTWNLAFKCLAWKDQQINKYKGKLATLKSAINTTVNIPPNGYMVIPAKSTDVLKIGSSMAMVSSTAKGKLTDLIEITPAVLSLDSSTAIVKFLIMGIGQC